MGTVVFALAVFGVLGGALARDAVVPRLSRPLCRVNEHYEKNNNRCQLTCLENIMGACLPTSACYCNTGYVRNSAGLCIKREKCPPPQTCGRNEHYEKNSRKCQLTCDNVSQKPIMPPCAPTSACFCNDGYVRTRGVCVKKNCCPLPICGPNEHYEKDTHRCTISCDTMHLESIMGPCFTNSGCFCDTGYVRNKDNCCIKRTDCPPRCNPNERYLNQTVQCHITCRNMAQEPYMGACVPSSGCFCIPGYVKNNHGVCIRREDCPRPCVCTGLNEVSTDCYNNCQRTCKNRIIGDGRVCTLACTRTGCVCKPGTLRHDNGTCVPEDQCSPPDCNEGEVYNFCGPSCPETCDNRGDTCTMCTAQCVPGCYCAEGTIKAPNGTCVVPKKCPPRSCTGQNEEFVECPPTCPPTEQCSNIWSRIDCSDPIDCCKPSCRCKNGFFRDSENKCISTQACIDGNGARTSTAEDTDETA